MTVAELTAAATKAKKQAEYAKKCGDYLQAQRYRADVADLLDEAARKHGAGPARFAPRGGE